MRIAFLHRQLAGGGTEADLLRMAGGLIERGHEIHLFCAQPGEAPEGLRLHRVPVLRAGRTARLLSFALLAPRAAARQRFDLVVGFGRTVRQDVVRVGGGTHRRYLAAMETAGMRGRVRGPYHRAVLWLEQRMFAPGGHRGVVAVSQRAADEVHADYGVPRAQLHVVYNGVDNVRFHPRLRADCGPRLRAELRLGAGDAACVAVGSGFRRKGFDLLLRLWRENPPRAHLLLVGRDERVAAFRREAARLGGAVHVLGPRDDVPALMAVADVVCVPSRQEAFGNVALEAMASGTPVVTSRVVGAAEVLEAPLDELVIDAPEDLAALRHALDRALGSRHGVYAAAARAQAEARPWSRHIDEIERVFEAYAHGA